MKAAACAAFPNHSVCHWFPFVTKHACRLWSDLNHLHQSPRDIEDTAVSMHVDTCCWSQGLLWLWVVARDLELGSFLHSRHCFSQVMGPFEFHKTSPTLHTPRIGKVAWNGRESINPAQDPASGCLSVYSSIYLPFEAQQVSEMVSLTEPALFLQIVWLC